LPESIRSVQREAVRTTHLEILVRIEVRVVNDDCVGGGKVDTDASGTRGEEEDEVLGARRVELVHVLLAMQLVDIAVEAEVLVTFPANKVLD
jgi:hypothetical protein